MKFKSAYCIFFIYYFTVVASRFEKSSATGNFGDDERDRSAYTKEAEKFLRNMNQLVDPCTDFYEFACGEYMKRTEYSNEVSPGEDRYMEILSEIKDILEYKRDMPGYDVSVARNIYTNCKKIFPDVLGKRKLIDTIARKIGLISDKYGSGYRTENHTWNKNFDWIDGVHKLRNLGLNFRFLVGLYVTPRSQIDKRNILEIREPFLKSDYNQVYIHKLHESLKIVNARQFINFLNGSFPLQKFIEGFLPIDTDFSFEDEIRVDETYIITLVDALKHKSVSYLAENLYNKTKSELESLLPRKNSSDWDKDCLEKAIFYDYNFQFAVSETILTERKKDFITDLMNHIMKTTKRLTFTSASFDEESRTRTIQKLSVLQTMLGYGNNIIETPALDWNDVDYYKYVINILKLSKYQMDAKFRQLNVVKDVREWEVKMIPSTYNAAYNLKSNTLYMPALFVASEMHEPDMPNYIHYGSIGFYIAHELGHAIDYSTYNDRFFEYSKNYNFAGSNIVKSKQCLRKTFYNMTGMYKKSQMDDFADLAGYKIAYYSFLDSEKKHGLENSLPGLDYNSRQMFWTLVQCVINTRTSIQAIIYTVRMLFALICLCPTCRNSHETLVAPLDHL